MVAGRIAEVLQSSHSQVCILCLVRENLAPFCIDLKASRTVMHLSKVTQQPS